MFASMRMLIYHIRLRLCKVSSLSLAVQDFSELMRKLNVRWSGVSEKLGGRERTKSSDVNGRQVSSSVQMSRLAGDRMGVARKPLNNREYY
jgi:hypothetical protein